jgi:hypothetical protein
MPYYMVGPPVLGLWGSPPMMFSPCPPWAGWYGPWAPPPIHFHPGWSGSVEGSDHGGYYLRDGRYSGFSQYKAIRNVKPEHPVS